jgi:branched-chain amino acid transport system permease protein
MRPLARRLDLNLVGLVVLCVVLLPAPLILDRFQGGIAVQVLLFALLGVAWNVMSGFAGEFSFGHAAFFGLGAYAAAFLVTSSRVSPWIGMLVGAVIAAVLGVAIGYLSFRYRLRGVYFALATFALAEMLRLLVSGLDALNASRGITIPLVGGGSSWPMIQFPTGAPEYFYVALALFALTQLAVILLIRSRWGLLILATREDAEGAAAAGVDTLRYRLLAISASAALTAVGGAYYAVYYFSVNPDTAFGSAVSISILLPAVVGGMGSVWGPVLGSVIVILLGQAAVGATRAPPDALAFLRGVSGLDRIIYGIALIMMIMFLPRGLVPALTRVRTLGRGRRRRGGRKPSEARSAKGGYVST